MSNDLNQPRFFDTDRWDGDPLMQRDRTPPGDVIATQRASLSDSSVARSEAILAVRLSLLEYLRAIGIGAEFQGIDFTHWLDACGRRPDPQVLDMRIVGGLLVALRNHELIEEVDHRSNGGDASTGHHACRRPVYAVRSLQSDRLGWIESGQREEAA